MVETCLQLVDTVSTFAFKAHESPFTALQSAGLKSTADVWVTTSTAIFFGQAALNGLELDRIDPISGPYIDRHRTGQTRLTIMASSEKVSKSTHESEETQEIKNHLDPEQRSLYGHRYLHEEHSWFHHRIHILDCPTLARSVSRFFQDWQRLLYPRNPCRQRFHT